MKYLVFLFTCFLAVCIYEAEGSRARSSSPNKLRKEANRLEKSKSQNDAQNQLQSDGAKLQRSKSENDKDSKEGTGVIIVTGKTYLLSLIGDDNKKDILEKKEVHMRGATRRGGQSAPRFGRINKANKALFVKNIAAAAFQHFTEEGRPTIARLFIAGSAQVKDKLTTVLSPVLKQKLVAVTTVGQGGEAGLMQAVKQMESQLSEGKLDAEIEALDEFFTQLEAEENNCVYIFELVVTAIERKGVAKLLVHKNLDMERCLLTNKQGEKRFKFMTSEKSKNYNKGVVGKKATDFIGECVKFVDYVQNKIGKVQLVQITDDAIKLANREEFLGTYGGVAAILHKGTTRSFLMPSAENQE